MITGRWILIPAILGLVNACSSDNISKRDQEKEQTRNNAAAKRIELEKVAGIYSGSLIRSENDRQSITLDLQIKEIPKDDGDVDPVMVPVLTGNLQFNYSNGRNDGTIEKMVFSLEKADFSEKSNHFNGVATNSNYDAVIMELRFDGQTLSGQWNAPSSSASGQLDLTRGMKPPSAELPVLVADYSGYFLWESSKEVQFVDVKLNGSLSSPDTITLNMATRFYFGPKTSPEYITFTIPKVDFNPITGRIGATSADAEISLNGTLSGNGLSGNWNSKSMGQMGGFKLSVLPMAPPVGYDAVSGLHGTYKGKLKNTASLNLPEKVMMTFVATPDQGGVVWSGNMRFYLGEFDSPEYVEDPFTSGAEFDFFSKKISAKTLKHSFTVNGGLLGSKIKADLYHDGLGKIAEVEVTR